MGLRFRFNNLPSFRPGERVLAFRPWVWALSSVSPPTLRFLVSMPPLWEAGLYVTDRRVLLVGQTFRLLIAEASQWFTGREEPGDPEVITSVRTGTRRLLGPYLEIISEDPRRHSLRSRELRQRFFMRDPDPLCRLIRDTAAIPE